MKKSTKLVRLLLPTVLLAGVLLLALLGSRMSTSTPVHAAAAQPATVARWIPCRVWDRCPVTQRYHVHDEHGVDVLTWGLPITALLSGTITFDRWVCWGTGWDRECVQDITWRLDRQVCYHRVCAPYMYVQIRTSSVWVGEHVRVGQLLGWSGIFIELGLYDFPSYGVGYPWTYSGIDPLKVWPWL